MTVAQTPRSAGPDPASIVCAPSGAKYTRQARGTAIPMLGSPAGDSPPPDQAAHDIQWSPVARGQDTQWAVTPALPNLIPPTGDSSRPAIAAAPSREHTPAGTKPADRQSASDTHPWAAISSQAREERGRVSTADAFPVAEALLDPALSLAADILDDLERVRVANENRLRQLTRSEADADGELRGFGMDESHPDVAMLVSMVDNLKQLEHGATLQLQRQFRRSPLSRWQKQHRGIGEKQAARLLASIGDPYLRDELSYEDGTVLPAGPRTVSALWAYCGLHVVDGESPKRRRGVRSNWSDSAKVRAHLIATSCLKQLVKPCVTGTHVDGCACSAYRVVYDERRAHTAGTHPEWTDGHSHNDALRVVSKAILRDLWRAARDAHAGGSA